MNNVIAVFTLLLLVAPAAAQSKDQQQILALDQALGKAIEAGDAVSFDKMTTDDVQFITTSGAVMNKPDRLALLKKQGEAPGFRTSDHVIRIDGNVAVVTGRQGPGEGPIRFSRVWLRQGNEWRVVVSTATIIQQPKP